MPIPGRVYLPDLQTTFIGTNPVPVPVQVTNLIGLTSRFTGTDADRVQPPALGVVDPNALGVVQYCINGFATRAWGAVFACKSVSQRAIPLPPDGFRSCFRRLSSVAAGGEP